MVGLAVPEDLVAVLGEEERYLGLALRDLDAFALYSGLIPLLQDALNVVHGLHLYFEEFIECLGVVRVPASDVLDQADYQKAVAELRDLDPTRFQPVITLLHVFLTLCLTESG